MLNLDRFSQGLPDSQEAREVTSCEGCGCEIYQDERVYVWQGLIFHHDAECLVKYFEPKEMLVEEAV